MKEGYVIKLTTFDRYYSTTYNITAFNEWTPNVMEAIFLENEVDAKVLMATMLHKHPWVKLEIVPVYRGIYFKPFV